MVGSAGAATLVLRSTVTGSTAVPPLESKVTVAWVFGAEELLEDEELEEVDVLLEEELLEDEELEDELLEEVDVLLEEVVLVWLEEEDEDWLVAGSTGRPLGREDRAIGKATARLTARAATAPIATQMMTNFFLLTGFHSSPSN